jgi:hypothetical protein
MLLAGEQDLVHVPEAALVRGCLGRGGSAEGVRVDLHERVVPVGDSDLPVHRSLDPFDLAVSEKRVRALTPFAEATWSTARWMLLPIVGGASSTTTPSDVVRNAL